MKKIILFLLIAGFFNSYAMELKKKEEQFFPDEFTGYHMTFVEEMKKYGGVIGGLESEWKTKFLPRTQPLFEKYGDLIIERKLGSAVLQFYKTNPNDSKALIVKRYAQAVAFRMLNYRNGPSQIDVSDQEMKEAEGYVPYNLLELSYIEHGKSDLSNHIKKEESRAYLNAKLQELKKKIVQ